MMRIRGTLFGLAFAMVATSFALETDDAYNRGVMAGGAFYGADKTRDWKLTEADGKGWTTHQAADTDHNGEITFEEFVEGADLPYPAWKGEVTRNVVYKRVNGEPVLLDIYEPLVKKFEKAPVFYYTHGGGWSGGAKEFGEAERPLFEALSREGFVCVSVMYRLVKTWDANDEVLMRDCLEDCRDGLRFLKKHEKELVLDMDRVVVFGSSAGGHIAQLVTFSPADAFVGDPALAQYQAKVAAGISWYGPADFRDTQLFATDGLDDAFAPDHWAKLITKEDTFNYEAADADTRRVIEELSPVWWLKKESAPLLHIHGDKDVVISPNHAAHLKKKAKATGAQVEVIMVKGAGHGWWAQGIEPNRKMIEEMCIEFARAHGGAHK